MTNECFKTIVDSLPNKYAFKKEIENVEHEFEQMKKAIRIIADRIEFHNDVIYMNCWTSKEDINLLKKVMKFECEEKSNVY